MVREPNIPLFLWVAAAIIVHLTTGGGAGRIADVIEEHLNVQRFVSTVRAHVRSTNQPVEVAFVEEAEEEPEVPEPTEDEQKELAEPDPAVPEPDNKDNASAAKNQGNAPNDEVPKPEEQKPEPKKKKPEEKKKPKKSDEQKPEISVPVKPIEMPKRIAIEQHVKDKDQENPNAEFEADEANVVREQTQARITSADQNDMNPTPGGNHQGPTSNPGDAHVTEVAQSEERAGEQDHAPGQKGGGKATYAQAEPPPKAGSRVAQAETSRGTQNGRIGAAATPGAQGKGRKGQQAQAATPELEAFPDLATSKGGSFTVAEARQAQAERKKRLAQKRQLPSPKGTPQPHHFLGLGARGTTKNGINLNLSHGTAIAAVGADQLAGEIAADGERRRSKHRGSWRSSGIERWRSAIENYVPHVKLGNQTAMNAARVPFASYLNRIHNRLHPIYAGQYLGHLDSLPSHDPHNDRSRSTHLEIVLSRLDGSIVDMGVMKTSGLTAFDLGVLESTQKAAPFGTPPASIVSPDGNVYLHWEFHRDPRYACSTYFARPKMLKVTPKSAPPPEPEPRKPATPQEGERHGRAAEPTKDKRHASR